MAKDNIFEVLPQIILILILMVTVVAVPCYFVIRLYRKYKRAADKEIENIVNQYSVDDTKCNENRIQIVFHVYTCFLNSMNQEKIDIYVNKENALECLKNLRNYNFKYGVFGAGGAFIPFLTINDYLKLKYKIKKILNHPQQL